MLRYEDASLPFEARAADLVSRLTLRCRRPGSRITVNGRPADMDGDHATVAFAAGETAEIGVTFAPCCASAERSPE